MAERLRAPPSAPCPACPPAAVSVGEGEGLVVTMCSVCSVSPAVRRGACWGCYAKFRREGLLEVVGPRSDTATRFSPSSPLADRLREIVERLSPDARAALHEATRPQNDAPPASPGRVVRHG